MYRLLATIIMMRAFVHFLKKSFRNLYESWSISSGSSQSLWNIWKFCGVFENGRKNKLKIHRNKCFRILFTGDRVASYWQAICLSILMGILTKPHQWESLFPKREYIPFQNWRYFTCVNKSVKKEKKKEKYRNPLSKITADCNNSIKLNFNEWAVQKGREIRRTISRWGSRLVFARKGMKFIGRSRKHPLLSELRSRGVREKGEKRGP